MSKSLSKAKNSLHRAYKKSDRLWESQKPIDRMRRTIRKIHIKRHIVMHCERMNKIIETLKLSPE